LGCSQAHHALGPVADHDLDDDDNTGMKTTTHTQSSAMLRWVGATYSDSLLYPPSKLFDIEEAIGVVEDIKASFGPSLYMAMRPANYGHFETGWSETDEARALIQEMRTKWVEEKMPVFMGFLSQLLGDKPWLASTEGPTIADCLAVPFLRSFTRGHIDHVASDCLEPFPGIVAYIKRFCALVPGRYLDGLHE
jgi:prostaglandin-H2 D-isomerase / glutathione transferase